MLRRVAMMAALAALLAPAGMAEAKKKKYPLPVVTSTSPSKVAIGETLTIRGRHFRRGLGRNTVAFKRDGAKAVLVKSDISTRKLIKVILSDRLADLLLVKDGVLQPTRMRIRVLSRRFGKRFTRRSRSPIILPKPPEPSSSEQPAPPAADGDCDGDQIKNGVDTDDDNDLLTDSHEASLKTDPCKRDSDGDAVEDGYEYRSSRDLNDDHYGSPDEYLPYPAKRPYPNALFADADTDYDGDGLTLLDEYKLWVGHGTRNLDALNYSDGQQYTRDVDTVGYDKQQQFLASAAAKGYTQDALLDTDAYDVDGDDEDPLWGGTPGVTDLERYYYDRDLDGKLSDDERDEDADGLPNWVEAHGEMTREWWTGVYAKDREFTVAYAGTAIDDADSDGDGIVDGADDQDHDDFPNVRELSRLRAVGEEADGTPWTLDSGLAPEWLRMFDDPKGEPMSNRPLRGWVHPFNPCLPDPDSRTCPIYTPMQNAYEPFNADATDYYVLN